MSQTTQDTGQTTSAPERASTAETTSAAEPVSGSSTRGGTTALSEGIEKAQSEAKSWRGDARLYSIISRPNEVSLKGKNPGWQYAFVSESASSFLTVSYSNGRVQNAVSQELPESQIQLISRNTLPVDRLMDSSEAMRQSNKVRDYLQENPNSKVSVSADSGTSEQPVWILQVPREGLQEEIVAVE